MKTITVIAFMLLSVLTGCQNTNDDFKESDLSVKTLSLTTHIDTERTIKNNQIYMGLLGYGPILGTKLPDNAEIGVCIHAFDGTDYIPYPSISGATHKNLFWKNTFHGWKHLDTNGDETAYYLSNSKAYLHTYYPYTKDVELDDSEGLKINIYPGYIDYMYGRSLSNPSSHNPSSELKLKHALASVTFTVQSQGYQGNCELEAITIHNATAEGELFIRNGKTIPGQQKKDLSIALWKGDRYDPVRPMGNIGFVNPISFHDSSLGYPTISEQLARNSLHIMVIPQQGVSEIKPEGTYLRVRVDGTDHLIPFQKRVNGENIHEFNWVAGQNFNYNLIMKANGSLSLEVEDFSFGGDWETDFSNPNYIITENGAEDISAPTHFNQDQDKISKHFEISTKDLNNLSWFEASGWKEIWGNNNHGTVNPNPTKGCVALREGGYTDWRMPTFNEYKLMFEIKNIQHPLTGSYWVGDYAYHKDASIIQNMKRVLINGATQNNSNFRFKVRCIRDIKPSSRNVSYSRS
ncbi:MAG: fimbrillin family protein [Bacteroidales bacterium]